MASLDIALDQATSLVTYPTRSQREILDKLDQLRIRLAEGVLRVAVLGQFKRGKSTLLNALLGRPLLPTGITPITAIPTFIRPARETRARITFKGDKEPLVVSVTAEIPDILQRYVSEVENPHNRLNVASVTLEVCSEFLDNGIVLVDTPGVGSTFRHNTKAAEAVLSECDVAIFIVSADPPITEVEVGYLRKVQEFIPKIFFALNKIDLLSSTDRQVAERYLHDVLKQQSAAAQSIEIFCVSAKQALLAKETGDMQAFGASGVQLLEFALAKDLASEKREIAFAAGRRRLISLLGELLFQTELEHKALLLPDENLKEKALTFEASVARFDAERQGLADLIAIDRKHLLNELELETEILWQKSQKETRRLVDEITARHFVLKDARDQIAKTFSQYFEESFRQSVELFRKKLGARLAIHQQRAGALINLVRQTAADLMDISAALPEAHDAFELKREPYWVAPESSSSLLSISASAMARFIPSSLRMRRDRELLRNDAKTAALRNVGNLEWAIRQNVDDSFRRFESSLAEQLAQALTATREAMRVAARRRAERGDEMDKYIKDSAHSVAGLSDLLNKLRLDSEVSA